MPPPRPDSAVPPPAVDDRLVEQMLVELQASGESAWSPVGGRLSRGQQIGIAVGAAAGVILLLLLAAAAVGLIVR